MKKLCFAVALAAMAPASWAQGYVGALVTLSRLTEACTPSFRCDDDRKTGQKFFAGAYLPDAQVLSLGSAKINRVEVGAMRMGRVTSTGQVATQVYVNDADGERYLTVQVPAETRIQADAIMAAAVMEVPLVQQVNLTAKLGLAYVSATAVLERSGKRFDSVTKTSFQPYVGLGVEYALPFNVQLHGGVDWTRYRVDGQSGSATQVGLGAAVSF